MKGSSTDNQVQLAIGDRTVARNHLLGAVKIANVRGGMQSLGLDGLLQFILNKLGHDKGLFEGKAPLSEV